MKFLRWIVVSTLFIVSICNAHDGRKYLPEVMQVDSINISIDPRLELLSVIQLLNDYFLISQYEHNYKNNTLKNFNEYKEHRVVKHFDSLVKKGFKFNIPAESVLYLNFNLTINKNLEIPDSLLPESISKKELIDFLLSLASFAKESKFFTYFNTNREYYRTLVNSTGEIIQGISDIKQLESLYGKKNASYNIVLVPMFHHGGFGPEITSESGNELFSLIGPSASRNGNPYFGSAERLAELINHEFSHSFIKRVFEKYKNEIAKSSHLYTPIKDEMIEQGYHSWEVSLNEHVVRAVTTYISYKKSKSLGDSNLEFQKERNYIYIDYVLNHLELYQQKREQYLTFDSYFPELLRGLSHL